MIPSGLMWKEGLSLPGMFLGWTVVVASVICEGKHMELRISELLVVYDNIWSGPGTPCPKPGVSLMMVLRGSCRGPAISQTCRSLLVLLFPWPGPPEPELGDKLGLPDFSSDIDPGPGEPFPGFGSILAWPIFLLALALSPRRSLPESGGVPDRPGSADDLASGSGKPFPGYGGALLIWDSLDAIEHKAEAFPRESGAGLRLFDLHLCRVPGGLCQSLEMYRISGVLLMTLLRDPRGVVDTGFFGRN